jgi:hypothetical protein
MHGIRREVLDLITNNERVQSALARGDQLTEDERALIRMCARELLASVDATRQTLA